MRRVLACLCAALLLGACTGEDKEPTAGVTTSESPVPVATAKPKVTVPAGPAPTTLVRNDLIKGTGAAVIPGQVVTVQYVGLTFDDGKQFDSSWDSGHPFSFTLGNGDVIQGWDEGVVGMRVGGRRMLVIPPAMAYGVEKQPGEPLTGETLVFVVDVIATGGSPAGAVGGG